MLGLVLFLLSKFNELCVAFVKWIVIRVWRRLDSPYRGRLPGKLTASRQVATGKALLNDLPVDIIIDSLLPFLSSRDVAYVEALVADRSVIAGLHERLRQSDVRLISKTHGHAVRWLYARKISPKRLILSEDMSSNSDLHCICGIVGDTRSLTVKSFRLDCVWAMTCLMWRFGENLSELDLRRYNMHNQVLVEMRRLSRLRVLRIVVGKNCTLGCVAETLAALPLLRELDLHNYGHNFIPEEAEMIAKCSTELTSLTLSAGCHTPDETFLPLSLRHLGNPLPYNFHLGSMASYFKNLHSLSLAIHILPDTMRTLAQQFRHLEHLTFYRNTTIPAFTPNLVETTANALPYLDFHSAKVETCSLVVAVARHCNELLDQRARYYAELMDVEAGAPMQPGPELYLQLRLYSLRLPRSALQALQGRHPDVEICRDE